MRKTIKEWLSELPEPYRTQALENCEYPGVFVRSIDEALFRAFTWKDTPQGEGYWAELHKIYSGHKYAPDDLAAARAEIAELKAWKESAMKCDYDPQRVAKLLGIGLGESIHDKVAPGIEKLLAQISDLKAQVSELQAQIKILTKPHVQMPGVKDE